MATGRRPDRLGDLRPRPKRLVTNRTFTDAVRKGSGQLTTVQRIALFLFAVLGVGGGIALVVVGFSRPRPNPTSSGVFDYVSTAIAICYTILVGCGALVLGLRTLRHVIFRAGPGRKR